MRADEKGGLWEDVRGVPMAAFSRYGMCQSQACGGLHLILYGEDEKIIAQAVYSKEHVQEMLRMLEGN